MTNCKQHEECIDSAILKAEEICIKKNISFTPIRKKVFEIIWKNEHSSIKAYDLLEELKLKDPKAQATTVYRALDFLIENGLIHKLESSNSYIGCNHPTIDHSCAFLICNKCDEVQECCSNEDLHKLVSSNINLGNFNIKNITLEIHGECYSCV